MKFTCEIFACTLYGLKCVFYPICRQSSTINHNEGKIYFLLLFIYLFWIDNLYYIVIYHIQLIYTSSHTGLPRTDKTVKTI